MRHPLRPKIAVVVALALLAGLVAALGPVRARDGRSTAPARVDQAGVGGENAIAMPLLARAADFALLPAVPTAAALPSATQVPPSATPTAPPGPPTEPPSATTTATDEATPTPEVTEPPTETATATAVPTEPKPTPASECRELAVNGTFEEGATGWDLYTNAGARYDRLSRVVKQLGQGDPVQPYSGTWLAELGGGTGGWTDEITNPDPAAMRGYSLPTAAEIVSATLRFQYTMATQEQRNRVADDKLTIALMNDERSDRSELLASPLSEETTSQGVWRAYNLDITQAMTQRPRWTRATLIFKSENSVNLATWHYIDDVSITLCTRAPEPTAVARAPAR